MRIGYPCINRSIGCKGNRKFRLSSHSEERLIGTIQNNLDCLFEMLRYNSSQRILFFRITSDLIPFASHPICQFNWQSYFKDKFRSVGDFIKGHAMRISMHPGQFTLINAENPTVFENSRQELLYHAEVLDLMELDTAAKIQLHVGGIYGDKSKSKARFIERYCELDEVIKRRLIIENDDQNYHLADCLEISQNTGIPVLFDAFHHDVFSSGETIGDALELVEHSWKEQDGIPMLDYSTQQPAAAKGKHAEAIDLAHFKHFLEETRPFDFDVMLEIKDKEKSALKAVHVLQKDPRFTKHEPEENSEDDPPGANPDPQSQTY